MICIYMYGYFIDRAPNRGFQGPIQTNCKQTIWMNKAFYKIPIGRGRAAGYIQSAAKDWTLGKREQIKGVSG